MANINLLRDELLRIEHENIGSQLSKSDSLRCKQLKIEIKLSNAKYNLKAKELTLLWKDYNKTFKPYVFNEIHWRGKRLNAMDPSVLLSTAPTFLFIARVYYMENVSVRIPTLWKVFPNIYFDEPSHVGQRVGSQLWHRDQTDSNILKLFSYFSNVDFDSGPLQYIKSSLPNSSKYSESIPLSVNSGYPPQEDVTKYVSKDDYVTCVGEYGTLVFADTAGLHRGGYAKKHPRITVQSTYLRKNPLQPQPSMIGKDIITDSFTAEQFDVFS